MTETKTQDHNLQDHNLQDHNLQDQDRDQAWNITLNDRDQDHYLQDQDQAWNITLNDRDEDRDHNLRDQVLQKVVLRPRSSSLPALLSCRYKCPTSYLSIPVNIYNSLIHHEWFLLWYLSIHSC